MITLSAILQQHPNLTETDLERWINTALLQAHGTAGNRHFEPIDAARLTLIIQLRDDLNIEEPTLPVILSLLDQLYSLRRQTRRLHQAISNLPPDLRETMLDGLGAF
jgi:chaperone modulatory protein CbpM